MIKILEVLGVIAAIAFEGFVILSAMVALFVMGVSPLFDDTNSKLIDRKVRKTTARYERMYGGKA